METTIIRLARPEDALAIARVHVDTWYTAYRGLVPDTLFDWLSYERRGQHWTRTLNNLAGSEYVYVAETPASQIVGFASGGPPQNPEPGYAGELYTLYVLEANQGQGIGKRLIRAVVRRLAENGMHSLLVWALEGGPANRFYAGLGGQYLRTQPFSITGVGLVEVGYGWPDTSVLLRDG